MAHPKNSETNRALPIDSPERRRLPLLLRRAWYGLNQAFRRRIAHTKVTPDQFTVLRTLLEEEGRGLTQNEIAQAMSSDPNTIASLLERMVSNKLVERTEHETDRRAHRIRLLPAGKQVYHVIREVAVQLQTEILTVLPEAKRDEFLAHLDLVADACRGSADKSPKKAGGKSRGSEPSA